MKLRNPLRSLNRSVLRRGNRRRPPARTAVFVTAEVLEQRQLLSAANVNLSVLAGAITLTATDNNDHTVSVHRLDSTNVSFDLSGGTQITYLGIVHTTPFNVAIPTVLSATVNLGGGHDTYNILDLSTLGNVIFNGHLGGEEGAALAVFSQASNVVIGGSIIFNVGNQTGAPLLPMTPDGSGVFADVFTNGPGNLTVNGSVFVTESGPAHNEVEVFTNGPGNLLLRGSVFVTQSGAGEKDVSIFTNDTGNLTINGSVNITDFGSGIHSNEIFTQAPGALLIMGNVSIYDYGTGVGDFELKAAGFRDLGSLGGDLTVLGSVLYNNSLNTTGNDFVDVSGDTIEDSGVVTIGGGLTLLLSNNAADGNNVDLGGDFASRQTQVTVGGPVWIATGAGADDIFITTVVFRSTVTINTGTNPLSMPKASVASPFIDSVGADFLDINGSTFNGLVSVSMYGPNAEIDVNNESGYPPSVFNGPVSIFMQGPSALVRLSNGSDSGIPVVFNSTLVIIGGIGGFPAGTLTVAGPVDFAFGRLLINFVEID